MRLTFPRFAGLTVLGGTALVLAFRLITPTHPPAASAPEPFPNAWPDPPPADVAALLGGLGPGSDLGGGWQVRGVSPVLDHRIVIDVDKAGVGFRVALMAKERDERVPPKRTLRYALYTIQPRPSAEALQDSDYSEVLAAIAARITEREGSVAVPAGL